jgi:type VI protein secretion system component Hcp
MTISRIVLAVVGAAGLAAAQNGSAINVKVDGVGDCPAQNWTFDASQAAPAPGTATGVAGRAQITALVVNRLLDQCSALLFKAVVSGQHVASVVLTQYDPATPRAPFLTVTLGDVLISNYQIGGSTANPLPGESVAISFGSIKIEYRSPNGGGPVNAGYDFKVNKTI